jgi:G3E family GTPase
MSAAATTLGNAPTESRASTARFVLIGGFLGAGKTTLAARLGSHLRSAGQRVAFITNDEGSDVLDTRVLRATGFAAEQITGGSFGRRFDALTTAATKLTELNEPEVFIAEPVGSCADLAATVNSPLRRFHKNHYAVAPFTVVLDPILAGSALISEKGASFSEPILYLYRKQLEEADFIVVNKIDLVGAPALRLLREQLGREFAKAKIFEVSARTSAGLENWFDAVMNTSAALRRPLEIDYEKYAAGEMLLSSLNCSLQLSALKGFKCNPIMDELARAIQRKSRAANIPIAHLKMTLAADMDVDGIATLHVVRNDLEPELGRELSEPVERGALHLSVRAECKPDLLHAIVADAMTHLCAIFPDLFARLSHMEHFRPSGASPTHRIAD